MEISKLSEDQNIAVLNMVSTRKNFNRYFVNTLLTLGSIVFIFLSLMIYKYFETIELSMLNNLVEDIAIVMIYISFILSVLMIFITFDCRRIYFNHKDIANELGVDISNITFEDTIHKLGSLSLKWINK